MNEDISTVTPTEGQSAEEGAQVEQTQGSEATTEQAPEQQTEQQTEETQKREPWFQKRIGELTREKYEARQAATQAANEAAELRRQIASGQQSEQKADQSQDLPTLVRQEAERLRAQEKLVDATNRAWTDGTKEFKDFDRAIANLEMVGANRDFVELAVTSDTGHKVLHYLGQEANLDEAARILRLPPTQMARELTKLEFKLAQPPAPKPVSKAPPPISPVGSGKAGGEGLSDDLSTEEWMRRHNASRRKS